MHDASGRYRVHYADVLRALGHYLDREGYRDLSLLETPDGFVITGQRVTPTARGLDVSTDALLMTDADLETLIEQAFARRGMQIPRAATLPSVSVGDERVRYEDLLRGIGGMIDERGWHAVTIVQVRMAFVVKGFRHDNATDDVVLNAAALQTLLAALPSRRRSSDPSSTTLRRRFWLPSGRTRPERTDDDTHYGDEEPSWVR